MLVLVPIALAIVGIVPIMLKAPWANWFEVACLIAFAAIMVTWASFLARYQKAIEHRFVFKIERRSQPPKDIDKYRAWCRNHNVEPYLDITWLEERRAQRK